MYGNETNIIWGGVWRKQYPAEGAMRYTLVTYLTNR